MTKTKRPRAVNFMPDEVQRLNDAVSQFRHILQNKKTDHASNKAKEAAWENIAQVYNASNVDGVHNYRSVKMLRIKYEKLKREAKIKAAEMRRAVYRKDGETCDQGRYNDAEQHVIEICPIIAGLDDTNESDDSASVDETELMENEESNTIEVARNIKQEPGVFTLDPLSSGHLELEISSLTPEETLLPAAQLSLAHTAEDIKNGDLASRNSIVKEPRESSLDALNKAQGTWKTRIPNNSAYRISPFSQGDRHIKSAPKTFTKLTEAKLELMQLQKQSILQEMKFKEEEHNLKMQHMRNEEERREEEFRNKMSKYQQWRIYQEVDQVTNTEGGKFSKS